MSRAPLPKILLQAKPEGLKFKPPASALARFDKSIRLAKIEAGEIEILGEIGYEDWGGTGAKSVKAALKAMGKVPVAVTLNSPGGDAFEGIAIYNLLREHGAKVTVNVIGLAASAASIVAMAGDTIKMGAGATMMIHSAWGIVAGNQNDMREFADVLDMLDKSVADLYSARTGIKAADVLAMMQKETWMSGADAVEKGFADTAAKDEKKKMEVDTEFKSLMNPAVYAASGMTRPVVRLSVVAPVKSTVPVEQRKKGVVYL